MGNLLTSNLLLKILANHEYVDGNLACCHSAVIGQLKAQSLANQSVWRRMEFDRYSLVPPFHSISTSGFIPVDDQHTIQHSFGVLKYLIDT